MNIIVIFIPDLTRVNRRSSFLNVLHCKCLVCWNVAVLVCLDVAVLVCENVAVLVCLNVAVVF